MLTITPFTTSNRTSLSQPVDSKACLAKITAMARLHLFYV
jgi:hypothetical protein